MNRSLLFLLSLYLLLAPGVRADVAGDHLVGRWTMDVLSAEGFHDYSGRGNMGQAVGLLAVAEGKKGQALDLTASTGHVNFGHDSALMPGQLTLMAWVRFDNFEQMVVPIEKYQWLQSGYYIKYDKAGEKLYGEIFDGDAETRKTVTFAGIGAGQWTHLAMTADGDTLCAYVNGRLVDSAPAGPVVANDLDLLAGRDATALALDELSLYDRAMPAAFIRAAYDGQRRSYAFDGAMSRDVLESYLARAILHLGLCSSSPDRTAPTFGDDLMMIDNIGAKFVGRTAYAWDVPTDDNAHFALAAQRAAQVHAVDPEIILQCCIFETAYSAEAPETADRVAQGFSGAGVEQIAIPAWVFEEFGQSVQTRTFNYEAMLYPDGRYRNLWLPGASVPDMTRLETQMWFYYRARRYIDAGYEAIHFGQVHLMTQTDSNYTAWREMMSRIRAYARIHARRHFILCDAHTHGLAVDGNLFFDFHSYPLRPEEVCTVPQHVILKAGFIDSIFGRSLGGVTPSGWSCDSLPYLLEFDNSGKSNPGVCPSASAIWPWGWDEISWFAHQPDDYRDHWLRYAWKFSRYGDDPNGFLQPITRKGLADPVAGRWVYSAHSADSDLPGGFDQEETIKGLFSGAMNPLGLKVTRTAYETSDWPPIGMASTDTLQLALAAGQASLSVSSVAWNEAAMIADCQGPMSPDTTVGFPADTATPAESGVLDITFDPGYTGSRELREVTFWIAPTEDSRRFYDLELYASTTGEPETFDLFLALRDQGESGLLPGMGSRVRVSLSRDKQFDDLHTLRIRGYVADQPEAGSAQRLATAFEEIDVSLGEAPETSARPNWTLFY